MGNISRVGAAGVVASLVIAAMAGPAAAKKKITCEKLLKPTEIELIVGAAVTFENPFKTTGQIGCHWVNAADEVNVAAHFDRGSQFEFSRDNPPGDYTLEPLTGIGQEAFLTRSPSGAPVDLWARTKTASFVVSNTNLDKAPAAIETEITALAKKIAKRLK